MQTSYLIKFDVVVVSRKRGKRKSYKIAYIPEDIKDEGNSLLVNPERKEERTEGRKEEKESHDVTCDTH